MRLFWRPSLLLLVLALLIGLAFVGAAREASANYRYGYNYYSYPSYGGYYGGSYYYPSYSYHTYVPSAYVSPYSSYYPAPALQTQVPCQSNSALASMSTEQLRKELLIRQLMDANPAQAQLPGTVPQQPPTARIDPATQLTPQEIQLLRQVLRKLATPGVPGPAPKQQTAPEQKQPAP